MSHNPRLARFFQRGELASNGLLPRDYLEEAKRSLFKDQDPDYAIEVLESFLSERDNPYLWQCLGMAYQIKGKHLVARSIYRNIFLKLGNPHIADIISAKVPYTKAVLVPEIKLAYVNIPKCGSSSIKDALLQATSGKAYGNASHFHIDHLSETVSFDAFDNQLADYFSFAIIRHPRQRLRSYYTRNISEENSLKREAGGVDSYYGLKTSPSYEECLERFVEYRQMFRDFRHHTDSITEYLGRNKPRVKKLFDISDTDHAINEISQRCGVSLPAIRNMSSKDRLADLTASEQKLEDSVIEAFYSKECDVYFESRA